MRAFYFAYKEKVVWEMSEKETMIRLEGIKKRFRTKAGELEVLHGVSVEY